MKQESEEFRNELYSKITLTFSQAPSRSPGWKVASSVPGCNRSICDRPRKFDKNRLGKERKEESRKGRLRWEKATIPGLSYRQIYFPCAEKPVNFPWLERASVLISDTFRGSDAVVSIHIDCAEYGAREAHGIYRRRCLHTLQLYHTGGEKEGETRGNIDVISLPEGDGHPPPINECRVGRKTVDEPAEGATRTGYLACPLGRNNYPMAQFRGSRYVGERSCIRFRGDDCTCCVVVGSEHDPRYSGIIFTRYLTDIGNKFPGGTNLPGYVGFLASKSPASAACFPTTIFQHNIQFFKTTPSFVQNRTLDRSVQRDEVRRYRITERGSARDACMRPSPCTMGRTVPLFSVGQKPRGLMQP